jgi:hypothetical protein
MARLSKAEAYMAATANQRDINFKVLHQVLGVRLERRGRGVARRWQAVVGEVAAIKRPRRDVAGARESQEGLFETYGC